MRGRATSTLTAMLGALGLSAAIVLGAAPALADPDPNTAPADPAAAADPAAPVAAPVPNNYPFLPDDPRTKPIEIPPPAPVMPWEQPQPVTQIPPGTPVGVYTVTATCGDGVVLSSVINVVEGPVVTTTPANASHIHAALPSRGVASSCIRASMGVVRWSGVGRRVVGRAGLRTGGPTARRGRGVRRVDGTVVGPGVGRGVDGSERLAQRREGVADLTLYFNGTRAIDLLKEKLAEEAKKQDGKKAAPNPMGDVKPEQILDAVGLSEFKGMAITLDFADDRSRSDVLVFHPEKPTGILSWVSSGAKEVELPAFIADDVASGQVSTVEWLKMYDGLLGMVMKLSPQMGMMANMYLAGFEQQNGFKIRDDFFGSLDGANFQVSDSDGKTQSEVMGFKVKNADKLGTALKGIQNALGGMGFAAFEESDYLGYKLNTLKASGGDLGPALVAEAAKLCESRRAILVLDSPEAWDTPAKVRAGLDGLGTTSRNAALYFPRLRVPDPLREGQLVSVGAGGAVAGIIARTDATRGVWKAPAGLEATLTGVPALEATLTDLEIGQLNPLGVNCLRVAPAAGRVVWGARTREGDDRLASEWKYLPVRRLSLYIAESLYRGWIRDGLLDVTNPRCSRILRDGSAAAGCSGALSPLMWVRPGAPMPAACLMGPSASRAFIRS